MYFDLFFYLYCLWGYVYLAINLLINLWLPNSQVDLNNLEEYISLVVDATVKTGITRQLEAFRVGFNQVFDVSSLQIFSPSELDYLLCGRREMWEADTLVEHIKFDHGYTSKSPVVINVNNERVQSRTIKGILSICYWCTSASSRSNNTASNVAGGVSESADDDLPSVMTCANYLKLPPYSTKTLMQI
uniref:HECT domain-containing protein n=1 Tax=Lactuca sativa TaxID=4236 RepID=A0A9R1WWY1_LACSA|nr:hypothetical protein LSAT_V11C800424270 [Lactuca sativa]